MKDALDLFVSLNLNEIIALTFSFVGIVFALSSVVAQLTKVSDPKTDRLETSDAHSGNEGEKLSRFKEVVVSLRGQKVVRLKSSLFYLLGFICAFAGFTLIAYEIPGGSFLFLNCTILFLYPAVRFLCGGKDSLLAMAWTIVIDFYLKAKIEDSVKKNRKRN